MRKGRAAEMVVSPVCDLADHALALDPLLHHPTRLYVCVQLVSHGEISFKELQARTGLHPGNLGYQIGTLERAGYIEVRKTFRGCQPATNYRLTSAGRVAWKTYQGHLKAVLEAVQEQDESRQQDA